MGWSTKRKLSKVSLQQKSSLPSRIYVVNINKSAENYKFIHIYLLLCIVTWFYVTHQIAKIALNWHQERAKYFYSFGSKSCFYALIFQELRIKS